MNNQDKQKEAFSEKWLDTSTLLYTASGILTIVALFIPVVYLTAVAIIIGALLVVATMYRISARSLILGQPSSLSGSQDHHDGGNRQAIDQGAQKSTAHSQERHGGPNQETSEALQDSEQGRNARIIRIVAIAVIVIFFIAVLALLLLKR